MALMRICGARDCARPASDRCFECGGWRCEAHLTHTHLPTFSGSFRETLCAVCLQGHLDDPDPYGPIEIEASPASSALA